MSTSVRRMPSGRGGGLEPLLAGGHEHHELRAGAEGVIGVALDEVEPLADALRLNADLEQRGDLIFARGRAFDPGDQVVRPAALAGARLRFLAELHCSASPWYCLLLPAACCRARR